MDINGDGVITIAEYSAYWKGRFKDIDANKDGKLMADEFQAATKQAFNSADANKDNVLVGPGICRLLVRSGGQGAEEGKRQGHQKYGRQQRRKGCQR